MKRFRLGVLTTALFAATISSGATAATEVAPEVVPGVFLLSGSTPPASRSVPSGPAPRGWSIVSGDPNTDPFQEASRLATELGGTVVPDVVLDLVMDPLFDEQWYLRNNGQTGGTPGADVSAVEAWPIGEGAGTVVAVIDSGIDVDHPDLVGQVWDNPDEIGGNGIDDDGNGLIDDDIGWDFVENDSVPDDTVGHGTKVAGTVASARDSVGVAGLAAKSQVMILRACAPGCSVSRVAAAVDYAVEARADVINLSLGGGATGIAPLRDAVERAGAADVIVVAAAGNSGADLGAMPFFPASFPEDHIISVAATDHTDHLAGFSNFGDIEVDFAAPGVDLLMPTFDGNWGLDSGTSFASPLGAASAAMVRGIRPDLSAPEVRDMLMGSVDVIPGLSGTSASGGRLNAGSAMIEAAAVSVDAVVSPTVTVAPSTLTFDASAASGAIESTTWTIDGNDQPGPVVSKTITAPAVIRGTVRVDGLAGDSATATVTALVGEDFDDIGKSVFFEDVVWLSANRLTDGCSATSYCTNNSITRGEAAALIRRALRIPSATGPSAFSDDDTSIFEGDLTSLNEVGILRGCNPPVNDRACPNDDLTRGEMAALLVRALDVPQSAIDRFSDDDASIFEDDIQALAGSQITTGCNPPANDRFCPDDRVTRGQLAAFLHRSADLGLATQD